MIIILPMDAEHVFQRCQVKGKAIEQPTKARHVEQAALVFLSRAVECPIDTLPLDFMYWILDFEVFQDDHQDHKRNESLIARWGVFGNDEEIFCTQHNLIILISRKHISVITAIGLFYLKDEQKN